MKIRTTKSMAGATVCGLVMFLAGCGGDGGIKLTPQQDAAGQALCSRMASCAGVTSPTASDMQACKNDVAALLQVVPDPDAFNSCIGSLTCAQIESDDPTEAQACVGWVTTTLKCLDATTLNGCNAAGKCATASCPDVCSLAQGSFDHCGYDSGRGWDVCWCRH